MRPRLAGATAALAVLMTLGACSPAAPPDPAPTTASSPSPTPSPGPTLGETAEPSPEPSPSPTDPNDRSELLVEPEEMENVDEEGAVAAAKYFMGLYEYVYLTGDLEMWDAMALPECDFCQVVSDTVEELHKAGGHRVSGAPKWKGKPKTRPIQTRVMWEVTLEARVSASTTYDSEGDVVEENSAGDATVHLGMLHDGKSWRTVGVLVETDD